MYGRRTTDFTGSAVMNGRRNQVRGMIIAIGSTVFNNYQPEQGLQPLKITTLNKDLKCNF
jgi:hypothetical protein